MKQPRNQGHHRLRLIYSKFQTRDVHSNASFEQTDWLQEGTPKHPMETGQLKAKDGAWSQLISSSKSPLRKW